MAKGGNSESKKGGIGAAFSAFTGAIDEVVNEVKRDLREMTPPAADATQQRQQQLMQRAAEMGKVLDTTGSGLAEQTVGGGYTEPQNTKKPNPNAQNINQTPLPGLPSGNLWQHLGSSAYAMQLRADACYHALTAADVESYARAIGNEAKAPFTLGLVAASLPALTDEDLAVNAGVDALDILAQILLKTLSNNPRLFGVVGAGPRQLWPDLNVLDDFLTNLLNKNRKIIALGPVGIDEPFAPYTVPQQQAQMALQLELAKDFSIPVLLTNRNSLAPLREVLQQSQKHLGGLPHLIYMDVIQSADELSLIDKFACHVLLRPEMTMPDFAGKAFYKQLPAAQLLLASGSPLVAPHGFAGHFNQPKFLENTLQAAASLRGLAPETLAATLNANLRALFKL